MQDYLDTPLVDLDGSTPITFRDFSQNIFVTGVTGGGKSSGPGAHILTALARSDAGGIICCAKSSEASEVYAVLKKAGREKSVIRWNGRNGRFNFLAWMLARMGPDGIGSVVEYMTRIVEMVRNASPMRGTDGDAFWLDEFKRVLRHTLGPVYLATGTLRMADIFAFVRGAPTSLTQFTDEGWQSQRPFFLECFRQAGDRIDAATGAQLMAYWREFAGMDPKLRSNILATFTMLDRFCHGWLNEATSGDTDITPALCFHGVIIILDMSRATLGDDGIILQMIVKDAFQTEVLARHSLPHQHRERFLFCYADEAQEFMTSRDAEFFAMSRSARCSSIYLTQSLATIYAKLGGANAHDRAHHMISNMGVRIFCANSCTITNTWSSKTIGKGVHRRASFNESSGTSTSYGTNMGLGTNEGSNSGSGGNSSYSSGPGGSSSGGGGSWNRGQSEGSNESRGRNRGGGHSHGTSAGWSEQVDWLVPPDFFTRNLKTGGPASAGRVSAIWAQVGKSFPASGGPSMVVEFVQ